MTFHGSLPHARDRPAIDFGEAAVVDPRPFTDRSAPSDPSRLDRAARRVATALLVLIVVVVAVIVFWPGPPDPAGQGALESYLRHPELHGLPRWITFNLVQNLANVVMFLPLGLLGSLALRRRNYLVVLFAASASGLIELTQLLLLPHRVASLEDVLANTTGALLGLLLSIPALRRRRKRRDVYRLGRRRAVDSQRRAARAARL
jgi:VanZ family protein